MKKALLLNAALVAAALSPAVLTAQAPVALMAQKDAAVSLRSVNSGDVKVLSSKTLAPGIKTQVCELGGLKFKRLVNNRFASKTINPASRQTPACAAADGGLAESFEAWDGTDNWLPEGWSTITLGTEENKNKWHVADVTDPRTPTFQSVDGSKLALIEYAYAYADEVLTTPDVKVDEGMSLQFRATVDPLYYYSLDNIDWDTYEYTSEKILAYTLKVKISQDGGQTWEVLQDFAEMFKDMSAYDAMMYDTATLRAFSFSLEKYVGKTIRVAFEYDGTDGNYATVDNVCVGYPVLSASFMFPASTLFHGYTTGYQYLPLGIAVCPVFSPVEFTNTSESTDANFEWEYENGDRQTETSTGNTLVINYHPYYDESNPNWMFYSTPKLTATAPKAMPATAQYFDFIQAGGAPELTGTDSETGQVAVDNFGLSTFPPTDGIDIWVGDDDDYSAIFGYSKYSDKYWTNETFRGDEGTGDYAYLDGVMNLHYTDDAPLVINGGYILAKGHDINPDNVFTFDIVPLVLTELGLEYELSNSIAHATCKGADILEYEGGGIQNFLVVPFKFDTPVVISSEDCMAYLVRVGGIHECGEYFSPYLSEKDNYAGFAPAWIDKQISFAGDADSSITTVSRYTEMLQSFAIMLDGCYPWLQTAAESVDIDASGSANLALDTYYMPADLSVEGAPQWLNVTFTGDRYNKAVAEFTSTSDQPAEATISIVGPGVSKTIKVTTAAVDGIFDITSDSARDIKAVYTPAGVEINPAAAAPGIYLVRYSDGTVAKRIIR